MNEVKQMPQGWSGFWVGAMQPSLAALLIVLFLNGAAFVAICLFVTPSFMSGPKHLYLMTDELDSQTHVTRKVLDFQSLQNPSVVILGDSLTKMCLANDKQLADLVAQELGEKVAVYNLATDAQTTWEMAAILDRLPSDFIGVVISALSLGSLSHGVTTGYSSLANVIENPRLGFTSAALDNEARLAGLEVPYRTGVYALDNFRYLLARRRIVVRNLIKGPLSYGDPHENPWIEKVNQPKFWLQEIAELPDRISAYEANFRANLNVVTRFVSEQRDRGTVSFILMEPPINPNWYKEQIGAQFFRKYHDDLRTYADRNEMIFLSASREASLLPADFVDYEGHIGTNSARIRCSNAIALRASETLVRQRAQLMRN
jgi:hypothetical protein